MNFFQAQEKARRRTGLLVVLLSLAVACLILLTQLLLMVVLRYGSNTALTLQGTTFWSSFSWQVLAEIAAGIVVVVGLASLARLMQLLQGGAAVATMLGGRLLDRNSQDPHEIKMMNVVEEMAIASGMPVPAIYILDDDAINAFAAGHDVNDVAIGVTRGTITQLSRDELQGVIAHEFSHIFNGDMRLNLRLIGILYGILFIGLIGRFLLDATPRRSRVSSRGNNGTAVLFILGLGLMAIGYAGTFFGNVIKAAISRQREFLADASAVQYTRNPDGIGGALKKIAASSAGSALMHPRATEASHLFFADGLTHFFTQSLFATHPPLSDRIRAIEPNWDGELPDTSVATQHTSSRSSINPDSVQIIEGQVQYQRTPSALSANIASASLMQAVSSIGVPSHNAVQQVRHTLTALPARLRQLSREPYGARAVMHCLLLDKDKDLRETQLNTLERLSDADVHSLCLHLYDEVSSLPVALRLPLVDLCLPSLKLLSTAQQKTFMNAVIAQIQADSQVSLFEWSLYSVLRHVLQDTPATIGNTPLGKLADHCCTLLAALAVATHPDATTRLSAFECGWQPLGVPVPSAPPLGSLPAVEALDQALLRLRVMRPLDKPRLLKACCNTLEQNGSLSPVSAELLRAVANTLDTPIPPITLAATTPS